METEPRKPTGSYQETIATGLGLIYFTANVLATIVAVFLRRGFGKDALGWNSLIAFFVLFFLAGAANDMVFFYLLVAFTFGQITRRLETFRIYRNGHVLHSQYAGFPYWAMKVPFVKSQKLARELVEPVICFVIGLLLCPFSERVGAFIALCGIGLIVRHCIEVEVDRKRVQRMHDARIEHEWYADQMRK